jgi:hypothetical protein
LYNSSYISNVNYNLSFPKDEGYWGDIQVLFCV